MKVYIVEAQGVGKDEEWTPITSHNKVKIFPTLEAASEAAKKMKIRHLFNLRVSSQETQ